jgi:uncharacterized membrane protein
MDVEQVLKRLKREFVKVNLLQSSLDALIVFLSLNLVLFLFGVEVFPRVSNYVVVAGVSVAVFLIDLAHRSHQFRLEIYEERNPELREILRTARDNPRADTFVSRAMLQDLMGRLHRVESDSIVPTRSIIQKILVVGVLSFLTLGSGITNFQVQDHRGAVLPAIQPTDDTEEPQQVLQNTSAIYGDRSDIDAADLDLGFNITGEGEREESDDPPVLRSAEDATLETTEDELSENLLLAKRYSVAIKEIRGQ